MKQINQDDYDFLWKVEDKNYLFTSIWYNINYQKRDFIVININNNHHFFVSKKERERLSNYGVMLFSKKFKSYEQKIKKQLKITEKLFGEIRKERLDNLTNKVLAKSYHQTVDYIRLIWSQYFWTEFFLLDKITEIIITNNKRYDLKEIKRNLRRMSKIKFEQRKYLNQTFYNPSILEKYNNEISKRLHLGKNIYDYNYKEVVSLLKGGKIKKINRKFIVFGKITNNIEIVGAKANEIGKRMLKIDKNINILKGQIGGRGFYRGKVRIINFSLKTNYKKEIIAMKQGEVLVSDSTGPEMILACKKAGAIITEEGGITSHAALVARELKIPCIIGTKIATKVLKDGDLVEVDANKGIVRIIKKHEH